MAILKKDLVDFQEIHLDSVGDIFEYKGKIIRVINESHRQYVRELMNCGLIKELINNKLFVETCISDSLFEDGRMVLEHRKVFPRQRSSQWTFDMMKDAAMLVLKMNLLCIKYGYEIRDCHQDNILFDGTQPVFIDFGSIVKRNSNEKWIAREGFMKAYYYPLMLWRRGYEYTINALMETFWGPEKKELVKMYYHVPLSNLGERILFAPYFENRVAAAMMKLIHKPATKEMEKLLCKINGLQYHGNSTWQKYQDQYWEEKQSVKRFEYEIEWISGMSDINSMVEIGANQGYFSYIVAQKTNISKIIATDYDERAVNILYQKIKGEEGINARITSLCLNFVCIPLEQLKLFCCDLVVANALTHHVLLTQGMSMNALVKRLGILTNRYIIVEFMPRGVNQKTELPEWYTLDSFLQALSEIFEIVEVYDTKEDRIIIFGKK